MPNSEQHQNFDAIKARLEEIVEAVSDENMPLDDALDLYEEAVELGMRVSDVLEDGIVVDEASLEEPVAEQQAQEAEAGADVSAQPPAAPKSESVAE